MNARKDSCGKVIYVDALQGLEKVNYTCVKTVHVRMMYVDFTVYYLWYKTTHYM